MREKGLIFPQLIEKDLQKIKKEDVDKIIFMS